jgi:hypothetical protein
MTMMMASEPGASPHRKSCRFTRTFFFFDSITDNDTNKFRSFTMRPMFKALLTLGLISGSVAANAQTESFTTPGSVIDFTVTQSGLYDINVMGGAGGLANSSSGASLGGSGADITGSIYLTAGTTLGIVVGDEGGAGTTYMTTSTSSTSDYAGGGGGGTFVYIIGAANPLLVAGGGGGGGYEETGKNASLTTVGFNGGGVSPGNGVGGTAGSGGAGGSYAGTTYGDDGGGGGGWLGNGTAGAAKSSGGGGSGAFLFTGGTGATSCLPTDYSCSGTSAGGFGGGGGGGYNGGGGGGGYSGGGGGSGKSGGTVFGGGGGSYIDPSVSLLSETVDSTGVGLVTLTDLTPVPLPASAWLMLCGAGGFGLFARKRRTAPSGEMDLS